MDPYDQQILDALAQAQAELEEPEPLFAFYERLLRAIAEKKDTIHLPEGARETPLPFEALGLAANDFYPWLLEIAAIFEAQDPGVRDEVEEIALVESIDLARQWYEQGTGGRGSTVDALLANALAPYLEKAAARLTPRLALDQWQQSHCPVCGGLPDFALWDMQRGTRELLCERCRTSWHTPDEACAFCGDTEPEQRGFYTSEDDLYRVEVCDSCGFYLKGMDRLKAKRAGLTPLPAAERLLTPGLDLLAVQEGFTRPNH
jgi:formate dehydrogenase maturation protein FdhE